LLFVRNPSVLQNKMTTTHMVNKEGKVVEGGGASVQAAANADWSSVPGYGVILANQPGAASWPMTAATFILVPKQPNDPAATTEALKFFAWAYAKGGKMAEELSIQHIVAQPPAANARAHRRGS
jgi:phosphate transport system substrate-binding protein